MILETYLHCQVKFIPNPITHVRHKISVVGIEALVCVVEFTCKAILYISIFLELVLATVNYSRVSVGNTRNVTGVLGLGRNVVHLSEFLSNYICLHFS